MAPRLPDFVVAGVRKAGTTWLDTCLRSHPQLYLSRMTKELYFFDRYYSRGLAWYGSHFVEAPHGTLVGDVSPSYFAHEDAPSRLVRDLPEARVLILLRDPIQRASSDFVHYWSKGDLPKNATFTEACAKIPSIISESMYAKHISRWLLQIPPEHLKLFVIEDGRADPVSFVSEVYKYLDIDSAYVSPHVTDRVNEARRPRSHHMASAAVRTARSLHHHGLHRVVEVANSLGLSKVVMAPAHRTQIPREILTPPERHELERLFTPDVLQLSALMGRDLTLTWSVAPEHPST